MNNKNLEGSYTVRLKESEKDVYSIDVDDSAGESKKVFSGVWGIISLVLTLVLLALMWWFYSMFQSKMENIVTVDNIATIEKNLMTNEEKISENELKIIATQREYAEIYKKNQELIESIKAENKNLENELKKILLEKQKIVKQIPQPTKKEKIKEETNPDEYYLIKKSKIPVVSKEIPEIPAIPSVKN